MKFSTPSAKLNSKSKQLLDLLPPGTQAGLAGISGTLKFPKHENVQHELSLTTDPYKKSIGIMDAATAKFQNAILRKYLFQNIMRNLVLTEPRTPTDSFCYLCDGGFEPTSNGLVFRLYGDFTIPYPAGYGFPLPRGGRTTIGEHSYLLPFLNLVGIEETAFAPTKRATTFRATKHVRGNFGANFELETGFDKSGNQLIRISHATNSWAGHIWAMNLACLDGEQIWEIEFSLSRRFGKNENCYLMLTTHDWGLDSLLVVSESEFFDTLLEGRNTDSAGGRT